MEKYLKISEEVKTALAENKPVVALESTIISHGMPYPKNVETALLVEKTVRENGAVPATICIIGGKLVVGASPDEIEYLGKTGLKVTKASRRDLPVLIAKGMDGATTVATTMIGAALAGIKVFATGGVGGVHRGAASTSPIVRITDLFSVPATAQPIHKISASRKANNCFIVKPFLPDDVDGGFLMQKTVFAPICLPPLF